ncbi:phosphotyrosine protein phosphatase [Hahella aquimaris]|uniref:low molecular weight protein tyrosine phosphatase family protein n=1 Tax=Hahella sp. HNIBRBA332 TaxID=3015983 RepID=UPI00273C1626|nr:phosphotyrosine protein phosphatase [Hahella sp. HNIBRBA332]WLQ12719.1 phosphotyrosine protein phosphatase [Hahella sp. HNIBRBA332]
MRNILFVCSRNQWRSPTAEQVWRRHPELSVRSAGTSSNSRKTIGPADLRWADIIMVMEDKHKHRLMSEFGHLLQRKQVHVLDIPDEYQCMDPELVEILQTSVASLLELTNF